MLLGEGTVQPSRLLPQKAAAALTSPPCTHTQMSGFAVRRLKDHSRGSQRPFCTALFSRAWLHAPGVLGGTMLSCACAQHHVEYSPEVPVQERSSAPCTAPVSVSQTRAPMHGHKPVYRCLPCRHSKERLGGACGGFLQGSRVGDVGLSSLPAPFPAALWAGRGLGRGTAAELLAAPWISCLRRGTFIRCGGFCGQ